MTVRDIAHVELYTRDKISAVRHYVATRGFVQVADCVEVDRSSALLRRGEAQLVITSGWATRGFLARNGEGVADVAVTCGDVAATVEAARAYGATVTHGPQGAPVVSGPGDVVHTLLPEPAPGARALPAGRTWIPYPEPAPSAAPPEALHRVVLGMPADLLGPYAAFCKDVLGFTRRAPEGVAPAERADDGPVLYGASGRAAFVLRARPSRDRAESDRSLCTTSIL
ncbi:VOC family protein [Streptomyces cinerochromogenes]|uniref:VOC family protein n=1 Tax=Streptomyces cinerochromogenes TaxID=66422 RepID=UPI0036C0A18A